MTMPTPSTTSTEDEWANLAQSTILIVDDNVQNVELLQAYLESLPCKILTAFDGVEAMKIMEEAGAVERCFALYEQRAYAEVGAPVQARVTRLLADFEFAQQRDLLTARARFDLVDSDAEIPQHPLFDADRVGIRLGASFRGRAWCLSGRRCRRILGAASTRDHEGARRSQP